MPRRHLSLVVPLAAVAVGVAGCGASSGGSSSATTLIPTSGTLPHGTVETLPVPTTTAVASPSTAVAGGTQPSSAPSTVVTVPGSGSYVLAARARAGTGLCVTPNLDGTTVPFTVSLTNRTGSSEPLARVAVTVSDSKATTNPPVAALSFSGICSNFTEPGNTIGPGQTVTYDGAASGVLGSAVLNVTVISTPANNTLAQISVSLS